MKPSATAVAASASDPPRPPAARVSAAAVSSPPVLLGAEADAELDAEIDPQPDEQRDERDRDQVEPPDQRQPERGRHDQPGERDGGDREHHPRRPHRDRQHAEHRRQHHPADQPRMVLEAGELLVGERHRAGQADARVEAPSYRGQRRGSRRRRPRRASGWHSRGPAGRRRCGGAAAAACPIPNRTGRSTRRSPAAPPRRPRARCRARRPACARRPASRCRCRPRSGRSTGWSSPRANYGSAASGPRNGCAAIRFAVVARTSSVVPSSRPFCRRNGVASGRRTVRKWRWSRASRRPSSAAAISAASGVAPSTTTAIRSRLAGKPVSSAISSRRQSTVGAISWRGIGRHREVRRGEPARGGDDGHRDDDHRPRTTDGERRRRRGRGWARGRRFLKNVIPAKAGTHDLHHSRSWVPAFAGMTP